MRSPRHFICRLFYERGAVTLDIMQSQSIRKGAMTQANNVLAGP
jgi:hypothetical protein